MIPGRVNKWTSSFLLIMLLVKAAGANSLGVRKPDTQFSEKAIETIRHARSGNDPTTAPVNPESPSRLFELYDVCSSKKNYKAFNRCITEQINIACKDDVPCIEKLEDEYDVVSVITSSLFRCSDTKIRCESEFFSDFDNAMKNSVVGRCQQADCSFIVDELLKKMFPECRRSDGYTCEPTTTTTITTTTRGSIAASERHGEASPSSSSDNSGHDNNTSSYSMYPSFVFPVFLLFFAELLVFGWI
ncbi:unnamed protein product [Caenorhabditis nigoni]|uniref:DUF19 domain-containing protein n=2 Tax=Caenorhabditis nigoni TaxID=1611254 RepID=A0A2G5TR05_9PELO|nr:hypothetical protein B9Z55_021192 [Caenorhabditis nigoni]